MASIRQRTSALAVVQETTQGVPVAPTAGSQYLALQSDFSMSPAKEQLENAELKASLGQSKTIAGLDNPTATFSHYLRHSGVEGQAPNYRLLLKGLFGNEAVAGVEYDTVSGSTTSVVKVNVGEGVNFQQGQALLVKHTFSPYEIRPVHSVSGDDLTVAFNLESIPQSNVDLGQAVTYYPNNESHPSLTLWHYLGNGGAVALMSGSVVSEGSITFEAGQLINASYSFEGISYKFNPITITAGVNAQLQYTDDSVANNVITLTPGVYNHPKELAQHIQDKMNQQSGPGSAISVTYSDTTGKFTFDNSVDALFELDWSAGGQVSALATTLGFSNGADDTGALVYESDLPIDLDSPQTPTFDSADPLVAKANEVFLGDATDNVCFDADSVTVTISNTVRPVLSVCSESGRKEVLVNEREVVINVSKLLDQYEVDMFRRFQGSEETRFAYAFGSKYAGNWQAGKCGCIYAPRSTIASFDTPESDGLFALELELRPFVGDDAKDEIYLSFV